MDSDRKKKPTSKASAPCGGLPTKGPATGCDGEGTRACRCGHEGDGPHPCHGRLYTCRRPASRRFYGAQFASLAGAQTKVVASDTWACDECWTAFAKGAR